MRIERIISALRIELRTSVRNRMVLYTLVAPLVIALVFGVVFQWVTQVRVSLAVPEDLPSEVVRELEAHAQVIPVESAESLTDLISREDDTMGVLLEDGRLTLVTFGDEQPAMVELGTAAIAIAQEGLDGGGAVRSLDVQRYVGPASVIEAWKRAALSCLFMIGLLVGMLAVSFSLMEDKMHRTLAALDVSPLSRDEYLTAKSLAGGTLSAVVTFLCFVLSGMDFDPLQAIVVSLATTLPGVGTGLILGNYARSELQLLSLIKGVGIVLPVPILGMLIPVVWHPALWWIPTYWLWQAYDAALRAGGWQEVVSSSAIIAAFGIALAVSGRVKFVRTMDTSSNAVN